MIIETNQNPRKFCRHVNMAFDLPAKTIVHQLILRGGTYANFIILIFEIASIVFESNQIKSIFNYGEFSLVNDSIPYNRQKNRSEFSAYGSNLPLVEKTTERVKSNILTENYFVKKTEQFQFRISSYDPIFKNRIFEKTHRRIILPIYASERDILFNSLLDIAPTADESIFFYGKIPLALVKSRCENGRFLWLFCFDLCF